MRVIWSNTSVGDLRTIESYLAERNPAAAQRILQAIREKAQQLRSFPRSGPALTDDLRYLPVRTTPYVIVYMLGNARIEILRVRHAREDWRAE